MRRLPIIAAALLLAACVSADPAVVSQAVQATLAARPTTTPIVVVVTVVRPEAAVLTVTPPAATPEPALTAALTDTATPAPSASPTHAAAPTGAPAFADDFSQPGVWSLSEDAVQRTALADGRLAFTLKEADQFRFIYDAARRARNFYAALTGTTAACQFRDRYGLLFRVQDGANYYQFEVDCDGRYRLAKAAAGALTALKDWTPDAAVRAGSGAVNELAVRAEGERLAVFVNGARVLSAADASFAEGSFGLYAGAGPAAGFTALFDDFRVWTLP